MSKSLYSLILSDEVIARIDRLATRQGTNRSALVNRILAEYCSMVTPEKRIETVLGGNHPFGVSLATIVGIPMYADIFGTIPIAEALLAKGALLGTVLAFMMGVTTLSLPSMIMLKKAIKPKLLGIFILICTLGIILVGYGFNLFQTILL